VLYHLVGSCNERWLTVSAESCRELNRIKSVEAIRSRAALMPLCSTTSRARRKGNCFAMNKTTKPVPAQRNNCLRIWKRCIFVPCNLINPSPHPTAPLVSYSVPSIQAPCSAGTFEAIKILSQVVTENEVMREFQIRWTLWKKLPNE